MLDSLSRPADVRADGPDLAERREFRLAALVLERAENRQHYSLRRQPDPVARALHVLRTSPSRSLRV